MMLSVRISMYRTTLTLRMPWQLVNMRIKSVRIYRPGPDLLTYRTAQCFTETPTVLLASAFRNTLSFSPNHASTVAAEV